MVGCAAAGEPAAEAEFEQAAQIAASSKIDIPVTVRGTGKATVKASVYPNPNPTAAAVATILNVPGLSATARVYEPLNEALFADAELGAAVKQVITLDFPGHGDSTVPTGLPSGVKFGDLTIDDNAATIVQALEALKAQGNGPALLVGHGAGALAIFAAQQSLLASGSSLAKLGVSTVIAYAPVPTGGRPWTQPATASTVAQYFTNDPELGLTYKLPNEAWARQGFTTTAGVLAANAPTPDQVAANGWNAAEPVATLLSLTEAANPAGGPALKRPVVDAGAFGSANGTRLIVLSFSENTSVPAADVADLYSYLTGDETGANYTAITAPDAVSNTFITNPAAVLEALRAYF